MQFEQTRILFDFVRAAFASPRTACTALSRRLRDGVSLPLSLSMLPTSSSASLAEVDAASAFTGQQRRATYWISTVLTAHSWSS